MLKGNCRQLDVFKAGSGFAYSLLPFRFISLDPARVIVTNFSGEYAVLSRENLRQFVHHELPIHSETYDLLKTRHFLLDSDSSVPIDLLAAKYRTKQAFISQFTSLFMFVVTLRCDHSCTYCQVSRQPHDKSGYDMSKDVADKAVDFAFRSPSPAIKIEFQGGEPLLNFEVVKHIVQRARERNKAENRSVEFVMATNLSALTDEVLQFCNQEGVCISTSLDGPRELHNHNRPRQDHDSFKEVTSGIARVREVLGVGGISALMTTTRKSLSMAKAIVDEYIRQGFHSIFLRMINPYGFAASSFEYSVEEWLEFYHEALAYILELNYRGVFFREEFTSLLLRRILTPYATGYVDLQSPAGIGISGIVVNYDGAVYASDESRMLGEMGDHTFRLGSLLNDPYERIMLSENLLNPLSETLTECVPQCSDCGVQPYCGSDPVRHYRTQGDVVGFKPTSEFCKRHMGVIKHLIHLLEDDKQAADTLRTWL